LLVRAGAKTAVGVGKRVVTSERFDFEWGLAVIAAVAPAI
jgi:hypothetical protein